MQEAPHYRHELKYHVDRCTCLAIQSRLRQVMRPDIHAGPNGFYIIRSIYFDNLQDKALREKLDGVAYREKFRIRYYNDDLSFLTLEKKIKAGSLCLKYDAALSEGECRQLLLGDTGWMPKHSSGIVRELYAKMLYQGLRPRVLVSYRRTPLVYAPGNVRITFDSEIRTSLYHRTFLEPQVLDISATDSPADLLMEVKYDAFLPEVIAHLIQEEGVRQDAFSKYGACRRFG